MHKTWLLLIYSVPARPTRKRAFVWRELKKLGAVYLHDGVAVLPERTDTHEAFASLARKIENLAGRTTLVAGGELEADAEEAVIVEGRAARAAEYEEISREARALLDHLEREARHRAFGVPEVAALAADVGKLARWTDQVSARDFFGAPAAADARNLVHQCAARLAHAAGQPAAARSR